VRRRRYRSDDDDDDDDDGPKAVTVRWMPVVVLLLFIMAIELTYIAVRLLATDAQVRQQLEKDGGRQPAR
jgi:hypothetical protein